MRLPNWVLGYHGCDRKTGEAVLAGTMELRASENYSDWLGNGIYFWENSARRALDWAEDAKIDPEFSPAAPKHPFVVGAVIDLKNCLDLLEAESIRLVTQAHGDLQSLLLSLGSPLPENTGMEPDRVIRRLDCAVINFVHDTRLRENEAPFDSVRAAFIEGKPLYDGAGFHAQTHIQICVRRAAQIVGYFRMKSLE